MQIMTSEHPRVARAAGYQWQATHRVVRGGPRAARSYADSDGGFSQASRYQTPSAASSYAPITQYRPQPAAVSSGGSSGCCGCGVSPAGPPGEPVSLDHVTRFTLRTKFHGEAGADGVDGAPGEWMRNKHLYILI